MTVRVVSAESSPVILDGACTKATFINGTDARKDFIECLELYKEIFIGDEEADPLITAEDFSDLYSYISAGINDCQEFEAIVKNCWQLSEHEHVVKETGPFAQKMEN